MVLANLLTKYIYASVWTRLFIFLIFYLCLIVSFNSVSFINIAECWTADEIELELRKLHLEQLRLEEYMRELTNLKNTIINESVIEQRLHPTGRSLQLNNSTNLRHLYSTLHLQPSEADNFSGSRCIENINRTIIDVQQNLNDNLKRIDDWEFARLQVLAQTSQTKTEAQIRMLHRGIAEIQEQNNKLRADFNRSIPQVIAEARESVKAEYEAKLSVKEIAYKNIQEQLETTNTQLAEAKTTKEQLRNSFERKLQAKDLIINALQYKHEAMLSNVTRLESDIREVRGVLLTGRSFIEPVAQNQTQHFSQIETSIQESKTVLQQSQQNIKDIHSATLTGSQSPRKGPDLR